MCKEITLELVLEAIRELECRFADVVERLHLLEEFVEEINEETEGDEDYEDDPTEDEEEEEDFNEKSA